MYNTLNTAYDPHLLFPCQSKIDHKRVNPMPDKMGICDKMNYKAFYYDEERRDPTFAYTPDSGLYKMSGPDNYRVNN